MKCLNIAWYISDHGFGHVMRNLPIMKELLETHSEVRVYVKTGEAQMQQLLSYLRGFENRLVIVSEQIDIGLVLKKGSLLIDELALFSKVSAYVESWKERCLKERAYLVDENIHLVISDIVPWILPVAKEVGIPSLLISNFTWIEIYKEYLPENLIKVYQNCYEAAEEGLFYALNSEEMINYLPHHKYTSLVCRTFNIERVKQIRAKYDRSIIFVSVGRSVRLEEEINVEKLPYQFIITEGTCLKGANVQVLPIDVPDTQDYILASDYVISKAGWGTVAEALLARKPLALLARDTVAEDRQTVRVLEEQHLCIKIQEQQLRDLENIIEQMKTHDFKQSTPYYNATKEISEYIYEKAKRRM